MNLDFFPDKEPLFIILGIGVFFFILSLILIKLFPAKKDNELI